MCRALKVLCVAEDADALAALKRAAVGAGWELAPGATTETEALAQIREERPHVLVVFGAFERLVARALELRPGIRVVADRELEGAAAVAGSMQQVRAAVLGVPTRGGPVR